MLLIDQGPLVLATRLTEDSFLLRLQGDWANEFLLRADLAQFGVAVGTEQGEGFDRLDDGQRKVGKIYRLHAEVWERRIARRRRFSKRTGQIPSESNIDSQVRSFR